MAKTADTRLTHSTHGDLHLYRYDMAAGTRVNMDKVFHEEIAIIGFEGCAWHSSQNGRYYFETPDCLVIRDAGQIFSLESAYISPQGAVCRELRFAPEFLDTLCAQLELPRPELDYSNPLLTFEPLTQLFIKTHTLIESQECALAKSSYLTTFFYALLNIKLSPRLVQQRSSSPQKLKFAIDYLRAYFSDGITLPDLAKHIGMNPFVLLRQFKKHVGITPHEYLQIYRVIQARKLIAQGHKLSDVAPLCGFADQSHLTRSFRKRIGVTPGRYFSL
ncbi:AraC family transcriptional regulator [Methylovorus menthalis]|uniref:helix-turn-helix transcriptional regulator n=1 Tax=Methylovorus menthalis TaxID=1002227 RepID=UPI001E52FD09|nr:AraC family transcriptional regulator [Methylovorus menthalis]MCB4809962.1 AraC family transcriptional regulator [Methylovorus menthalis]